MRIDDIFSSTQVESPQSIQNKRKEEGKNSLSSFGGQDTVKISDEARERLAAENANKERKESDGKSEEEGGTEASGGASGSAAAGSADDQLEALEKQLKKLQAELAKIVSNDSIPSDEKEVRVAGLQSQIGEVASMIAELKGQQAKSA